MQNSFSKRDDSLESAPITMRKPVARSLDRYRTAQRPETVQGDRNESMMVEYLCTLSRHRWNIAVFALAGCVLGLLLNFSSLPYFRARTSLDIQTLNNDFMNMRAVAPTGDSGGSSAEVNVQTQIKLLQSDTLLLRTVDSLQAEPHPINIERTDLASQLLSAIHLPLKQEPLAYNDLVEDTAKHIIVKPLGVTRLVEVTCDSWSAEFAAKFCNRLITEFKDADLEQRGSESEKTSLWLTKQVADIKLKAEESQRKLEAATGGNGLVLTQESSTVGEERLRQIQSELVKAQADRMEKEAQQRIASSAAPGTIPSVLDSPEYRRDEQRLAELRNTVAQLVPPLTEENPKVIHLRSQIKEVETGMAETRATNASRMRNEYDAARHRESLLTAAYGAQEATVSTDLGKAAQVTLLRREVESEQQLYQTLLQRAKEAGFASAMQASTVRVVDAARKSRIPVSPKRGTQAATGLLLGSLCGFGFAFFKDRNTAVFRMPGDVERYLHVNELGVIPTSEAEVISPSSVAGSMLDLRPSGLTGSRQTAVGLARWGDAFSVVAEAYRSTTFSILLSDESSRRARIYVVSSPNAGEGKTTVTTNLGVALSKAKLRVVIVDGDLRKPGMHNALGVKNDVGLRNLLRGEMNLERTPVAAYCQPTAYPNLFLVPAGAGSEEVVELLHSPHLHTLIDRLQRDFDVILIDTPPMLHMADARIFARFAQGAILILRAAVTSRDQAAKARDLFENDRVRLIGTILNAFDPAKEGRSHYYESYYRYQSHAKSTEGASSSS